MADETADDHKGGGERPPVEEFFDELDLKLASRYRVRLGRESKLVSLTRLPNGRFRACLSVARCKRLRFVREGTTRVRAMENAEKAYAELLRLLLGRGAYQAKFPAWPEEPEL